MLTTNIPQDADAGTAEVADTLYLGSRAEAAPFLTGDLAELLVYDGIPSVSAVATVENYLLVKYGIA